MTADALTAADDPCSAAAAIDIASWVETIPLALGLASWARAGSLEASIAVSFGRILLFVGHAHHRATRHRYRCIASFRRASPTSVLFESLIKS